jgi:hypothetical protein
VEYCALLNFSNKLELVKGSSPVDIDDELLWAGEGTGPTPLVEGFDRIVIE